jgi:hypothetical protein
MSSSNAQSDAITEASQSCISGVHGREAEIGSTEEVLEWRVRWIRD